MGIQSLNLPCLEPHGIPGAPQLLPAVCISSVDAIAQGPETVFATAMLLGDLFPAEWPAPGRARQLGKPHPPPPGMGEEISADAIHEQHGCHCIELVDLPWYTIAHHLHE